MTHEEGSPPPEPPTLGPAGRTAMVLAVPAAILTFFLSWRHTAAALVLTVVAVVGSFVLVLQRRPVLRAVGAGLLGGFGVALLVIGACTALVVQADLV